MLNLITLALFLTLIFVQDAVLADSALPKPFKAFSVRAEDNSYINLVRGLLRPRKGKILNHIIDIPCKVLNTLENDANEAREFVKQLENGEVPSIIKDLPDEVFHEFRDVINIALSLPSEILNDAATDAANVFNDIEDGSIIQDIESLSGVVLSDVTKGWAGFTDELTDAWGHITSDIECVFKDCSEPSTVRSCRATATAKTTSDGATATMTQTAAQRTTPSLPRYTSTAILASIQNPPRYTGTASMNTTQSPPQYTVTASLADSPSPPQYTLTTRLTSTRSPPQYTGTAGAANTQSPAQYTVIPSLASTQNDWAGLDILMITAVGIFVCALYL